MAEASGLKAGQPESSRAGISGGDGRPSSSRAVAEEAATEEAFSSWMRSALYPGAGPSADRFADLELVDAAFGQRGVAEDIHLLPDIDNPTLMKLSRAYASRNALISRALCWRLSLAAGVGAQARRANAELRVRAEVSDKFEKLVVEGNENLMKMRALYEAALKEASEQKSKAEMLQGLLAKNDDACQELAQIKSRHAEEIGAVREHHKGALDRLRKEAEAEMSRLNGMLGETLEQLKQRDRSVADMSANVQWQQEQIKKLDNELSQARSEAGDKQSRINSLKERVEVVRADKLRAIDEAKGLSESLARAKEEVAKLKSDSANRVQALQGELSSSRAANLELEAHVGELEGQATLLRGQINEAEMRAALLQGQLTEAETRLAALKGERDAISSEAYDLGAEECRDAIFQEHPEWDLSFLKAKAPADDISTDEGEDEYIDDSDVDADIDPYPGEAVTPSESLRTTSGEVRAPEMGESSRAPEDVAGISKEGAPTTKP